MHIHGRNELDNYVLEGNYICYLHAIGILVLAMDCWLGNFYPMTLILHYNEAMTGADTDPIHYSHNLFTYLLGLIQNYMSNVRILRCF